MVSTYFVDGSFFPSTSKPKVISTGDLGVLPNIRKYGGSPVVGCRVQLEGKKEPSTKYVETMKERMKKAYELASRSPRTAQERQKSGCDKKVRGAILQPGDRVLVKIVAFDAKHKIADKWEEEPYGIVSQPNRDIPVYVVQRENGEGRKRTLHRNLLLPIGFLPEDENSEKPNEINPAPKWQRLRKPRKKLIHQYHSCLLKVERILQN
jgi:hypothetical protein